MKAPRYATIELANKTSDYSCFEYYLFIFDNYSHLAFYPPKFYIIVEALYKDI